MNSPQFRPVSVHSVDRFAIAVPKLEEAEAFYAAFGLDVERQADRLLLRAGGAPHVWGEVSQGLTKKLLWVRFGIYERDLADFEARLSDIRIQAPFGTSGGVWCQTPEGTPIEIAVGPKCSPDAETDFALSPRCSPSRGASARSRVAKVRPRRLSHLALFTADVPSAMQFYEERLGLRLSDRSGDDVAFMHTPHGSDHHLVALARSTGPGLHHSSWDVQTIDDVGQGAAQMEAAGYARGWGLGRHVLGSNYFHYVRDPWGSYAEYSAGMDYIPAGVEWAGGDHPGEDSFYQWGPPPPEDFIVNYEDSAGA